MLYDLGHFRRAEVAVGHKVEVRFDLIAIIRGQIFGHGRLQRVALDPGLLVVRFLVG